MLPREGEHQEDQVEVPSTVSNLPTQNKRSELK